MSRKSGTRGTGAARLGPRESRVLEAMWRREGPCTVADLRGEFPGIAYTTLMTTLDRLYRKGLLTRDLRGRAYAYRPALSRGEIESRAAREAITQALSRDPSMVRPLMSMLIDVAEARDGQLIEELKRLIADRDGKGEDA